MKFNSTYLEVGTKAHQSALRYNVQDDLLNTLFFKELSDRLGVTDDGMRIVLGLSFVDSSVLKMEEHNKPNYHYLMSKAISAVGILHGELDGLLETVTYDGDDADIIDPILTAAGVANHQHPIHKFCDERNKTKLFERLREFINTINSTIVSVQEH